MESPLYNSWVLVIQPLMKLSHLALNYAFIKSRLALIVSTVSGNILVFVATLSTYGTVFVGKLLVLHFFGENTMYG